MHDCPQVFPLVTRPGRQVATEMRGPAAMKTQQGVIEKRDEYYAYGSVLEAVSQGLYPDRKHILREFVQNAYDALGDLHRQSPDMPLEPVEISTSSPSLIIADKGIGMSGETMRRYRYLGFSDKRIGSHAGFRGIGKFSAISVCDHLIVRSSMLGDTKSYQVEIDAAAMLKRLQDERNPPLEALLREHSRISETSERPELHYTFVELHGIRKDASELLDENTIKPYLIRVAPLPFDPAFPYGKEVSSRLQQVDPRFVEVELRLNGKPIFKPFLENASRPDFREVFAKEGSEELIAFTWFCQHRGKGQFRAIGDGESQGLRHPLSGLQYRVSNFAIGDTMLTRTTLWHTTPERAFYFFGEIHVLDSAVIPTSDRDDFEDTTARGRLYGQCRGIATTLSFRAGRESQRQRFTEVVTAGHQLVTATQAELEGGQLESELKEDRDFQIKRVLDDVSKRLKQSNRLQNKDDKVVKRAKQVIRRAERLRRTLKTTDSRQVPLVDITKILKMDAKTKKIYDTIIMVLREEFRSEPQRFAALVRKIHDALRGDVAC
jgi:hypothetical protein